MKKIALLLTLLATFVFSVQEFDPEKDVSIANYFEKNEFSSGDDFRMIISIGLPEEFHISDNDLLYFDTTGFPDINAEAKNIAGKTVYKGETVYKGTVDFIFEGNFTENADRSVLVGYQICSETGDESCYMPVEKELKIDFSSIDPSMFEIKETSPEIKNDKSFKDLFGVFSGESESMTIEERLAAILEGSQTWTLLVFVIAFLGGILDSMTPCVYPVIPVVISYMGAKSGKKKSAGFTLSLFFVIGLAITYSVVGLLASFLGGIFGVGDIAANPVVRVVIASIFTILALSMFGLWDMNLISSEQQTKLMQKGKESSGVIGAVIIGMVSGVVAAPCVGPVLAVLLIHVATAGDVLYGWLLFIAFAFGLGLLFIVIGTFSGAINALPHAGAWMMKIKKFFGVVMIGAALYFLSIVIPENILYFIISLLTILLSVYIGAFEKIKDDAGFFSYLAKAAGIFILMIGLVFSLKTISYYVALPFGGSVSLNSNAEIMKIPFDKTDSETEIVENAVSEIAGTEKLVMVDLWAEWCMNCVEMDKTTWKDPEILKFASQHFVPIKLDFTDKNSEFSKKYISEYLQYGARNIPLILFINGDGEVVEKVQGLVEAEIMLKKMKKIVSENK